MPSTGKTYAQGLITLEILVAFTILTMCISAVILLVFGNQAVAVDSEITSEAIYKASQLLEDARAISRKDFSAVNSTNTQETSGPLAFTKRLDVIQTDLFTKEATSSVSWQVDGRPLSVELTTLLTDPEAVHGGDTCSSTLEGDWEQPTLTSYEFGSELVIPNDASSTYPIKDIDVLNGFLYVVVSASDVNTNPTFFKLSISDSQSNPIFVNSMDNNPTVRAGLNAVRVADNYAYVANANGANFSTCASSLSCSQLQVIDVNTMAVVGRLKIPGVTGSGGQAAGNAIFYKNGIVYLGLAKTLSGPEFNIIDVGGGGRGGSPTNPVYLSGLSIGNGVNDLIIKGGYAYIASPNDEELKIINISNPSSPQEVGGFNAPQGGGNNGNGKSLAVVGDILYLGRTLLAGNELYVLDKTNQETTLPVLTSRDVRNSANNNTSINGMIVRDYLIFLLTNDNLQILKQDNSYSLTLHANPLATPSGNGTTVDCEGNLLYFASLPSNNKSYISKVSPGP